MKAVLLALLLSCLPVLVGYYLNHTAPHAPTRAYRAGYCTRYCTLHGCRHATPANSPAYFQLRPVYAATIRALQVGGSYQLTNVVCYLLLIPSVLMWLTYKVLRDAERIRQLKHQRV